jgi:hypothetical protein
VNEIKKSLFLTGYINLSSGKTASGNAHLMCVKNSWMNLNDLCSSGSGRELEKTIEGE